MFSFPGWIEGNGIHSYDTPFGSYKIERAIGNAWFVSSGFYSGYSHTLEDAKNLVEDDYKMRIRDMIQPLTWTEHTNSLTTYVETLGSYCVGKSYDDWYVKCNGRVISSANSKEESMAIAENHYYKRIGL